MRQIRSVYPVFYLFSAGIYYSCATPGAPTGGPLDKTPPKIITYQPENLSKNVSGKEFTLIFDEWVQITNPRQQVIISPPVEKFPDITARKNEVTLQFKDPLLPNTTYSIFFGESIKDVRESNPAENIRYVFSTGPEIDSLMITGQVVMPAGQSLPENSYVLLYTHLEDSAVAKEKPAYAYKLNKQNDFRFEYLPSDTFRLVALSDKNNNLKYDLPTEWIGEYPQYILLNSTLTGLTVPLLLPEPEFYQIAEYNTTLDNGILRIRWNKTYHPLKNPFSVRILQPGTIIIKPQYFTTNISEYFIISDSITISCEIITEGKTSDTIRLKADPKVAQSGSLRTTPQAVGKYSNVSLFPNQPVIFHSQVPIATLDEEKIVITDSSGAEVSFTLQRDDSLWSFSVYPDVLPGMEYRMVLQDSAVCFLNKTCIREQSYRVSQATAMQFGKIKFHISLPSADTAYLVSIKTSNGKILSETFIDGDTQYVYTTPPLTAGAYVVEIVEDKNRSYTWNGGSFWKKSEPERVFRSEPVNVKENWEQEIRVIADFTRPVIPLPLPEEKEKPISEEKLPSSNNQGSQERRPLFDR